jgi:peroxiredoxin
VSVVRGAAFLFAAVLFMALPRAGSADVLDGERPLAPDFRVKSVTGETLRLAPLLAKGPVLLDFWATWCKPCLASLPEIQSMHARYGDAGLTVIGVSIDGPRNFAKVRPFARRLGLEYPIVLDEDGSLQRSYQVQAIPTAILIGADGRVTRVMQGFRPGESEALEEAVRAALAPEGTPAP